MQLLKNKTAFITGGTAGIGKGIALGFAKQGASVAICGTNRERAEQVKSELEQNRVSSDQQFTYYIIDVSNREEVENAVQEFLSAFKQCDILVNNAGITRDGLLMRMKEVDWDDVLRINLKAAFHLCQLFMKPMLKARQGKIINVSSVVGLIGNPGQTNYAAAKAGLIGFTKSLAQEIASRKICVNCIAPGFIETKMTDVLSSEQKEHLLKSIPMARLGTADEVANLALFLASPLSDYITGQTINVDGGMVTA